MSGPIEADWTESGRAMHGQNESAPGNTTWDSVHDAALIPTRPFNLSAGIVWARHADFEFPSWVDPYVALDIAVEVRDALSERRRLNRLKAREQKS